MQQLTQTSEEATRGVAIAPDEGRTFAELEKALRRGRLEEKIEAADQLRHSGSDAVLPLCEALRDRDVRVRVAAAQVLAEVGDERAIPALVRALKALFPGGSPFRAKVMTLFLMVTTALVVIAGIAALFLGKAGEVFEALSNVPTFATGGNATAEPPARVMADALARIAERSPTPELRRALPALRELVEDSLLQDKRTRAVSRAAAKRIEAATAGLEHLPVPATAPATDPAALPRPVEPGAEEAGTPEA